MCGLLISIRLFLMTATYFSTYTAATNLTYTCYPDATIKVQNPGDYTTVFANNSLRICNTTWESGKQIAYIRNCGMDDDIIISFSHIIDGYAHVLGGLRSIIRSINCNQIPSSGVFKNISVGMDVSIEKLKLSTYSALHPEFKIHSGIYFDSSGYSLADTAYTGTPLFWIMKSNSDEYRIRPDACWAYSGKQILDTVPKKRIYENGCTVDESLLTSFLMYTYSRHSYGRRAILYSFAFYGSEYITMECRVRVCPHDENDPIKTFCETDTCDDRKKREYFDALAGTRDVTVRSQFRVIDPNSGSERLGMYMLLLVVLGLFHTCCSD